MDAGNIIYLIAIIIYFLFTVLKKPKQGQEPENTDAPGKDQQQKKPASFEDLLKEIRQSQQERERDLSQSGQGKAIEELPTANSGSYRHQEIDVQPAGIDQPRAYRKFQGEVSERALPKMKTLDEQVSLTATIEGIKSDIRVENIGKKVTSNKYKSLLRNPETVKDAVVLSEILNRKHF